MVRTQIQLTERQAKALKRLARRGQASMAELIRRSIDDYLRSIGHRDRDELKARALAAGGRFHSGTRDLSAKHDSYLADAFEE